MDTLKQKAPGKIVHGLSGTPLYQLWGGIIQRCYNSKNPGYINYGGRGIRISPEWRHNPKAFCDYVMKLPDYGKDFNVLDRINNDGNYEPGNLRWTTYSVSNANVRMPKHNTTGYMGVSYAKKDKAFVAYVTRNFKRHSIGNFKTAKLAHQARTEYIEKYGL